MTAILVNAANVNQSNCKAMLKNKLIEKIVELAGIGDRRIRRELTRQILKGKAIDIDGISIWIENNLVHVSGDGDSFSVPIP